MRYLRLSLMFFLSACGLFTTQAPVAPPPAPPLSLAVGLPANLQPLRPALAACHAEQPQTGLFLLDTPPGFSATPTVSLTLRLGEPRPLPDFAVQLGWEAIVVITHPSNPVRQFSQPELQAIFSGEIERWETVGGSPGPIRVWVPMDTDPVRQAFENAVMPGAPVVQTAFLAPMPAAMLEAVGEDPAAIGYLPGAWLTGGVQSAGLPDAADAGLALPLLALAPSAPAEHVQVFLRCLQSGPGQAAIAEAYKIKPPPEP